MEEKFVPLRLLYPWPNHQFPTTESDNENSILDTIGISSFDINTTTKDHEIELEIGIAREVKFNIVGLEGFEVVLGDNANFLKITAKLCLGETTLLSFEDITIKLRFPTNLIKKMKKTGASEFIEDVDSEGNLKPFEIKMNNISLSIDSNWNIELSQGGNPPTFSTDPFKIGDSEIVVEPNLVSFRFSDNYPAPTGFDNNWKGVLIDNASVHLPDSFSNVLPNTVHLENLAIGTGGFSGKISGAWSPQLNNDKTGFVPNSGAGSLFGIPFGLKEISLEFNQNKFVDSSLNGTLILPFFDGPIDVNIGFTNEGKFTVGLTGSNNGSLRKLTKPDVLELFVNNIEFKIAKKILSISIGGSIQPLFGNFDWPVFDVKAFTIDSKGNVSIDGGWIEFPKQLEFDLKGFKMELTKFGLGKEDDGSKWLGVSGGITIVSGLEFKGGVEGLQIIWKETSTGKEVKLKVGGINVAFEVPGVLDFAGEVNFIDEPNNTGIRGGIKIKILPLEGFTMGSEFMAGKNTTADPYNYFYIYMNLELPMGILLAPLPISIYGFAGLFGYNTKMKKGDDEAWFEEDNGDPGFYKKEPIGITNTSKWTDQKKSLAFGAGLTVGTSSDNGYTVSAKLLLVVLTPGPVIVAEGKANLLKDRGELDDDPMFRMLAVFDNNEGIFLMNVEANYKYPDDGKIVSIKAGAEAYFNFYNSKDWHFYIGQNKPESKRISARILELFDAYSFLMIDNESLATGAGIIFDKEWKKGPVEVILKAWMEGFFEISWSPMQAQGSLNLGGSVKLRAFGFGIGLTASVLLAVKTPTDWYIMGELAVTLELPKPLKDRDVNITLKWEEEKDPPWPVAIAKIGIEHPITTEKWDLRRLPNYTVDSDNFLKNTNAITPSPSEFPTIPLDARPALTFGHPVDDIAHIGNNPQPTLNEIIEKWEYRYTLQKVRIEKATNPNGPWSLVAEKYENSGNSKLNGYWQVTPSSEQNNTKLILFSNSSFEISRELANNESWLYSAIDNWDGHPCNIDTTPKLICVDFENTAIDNYDSMLLQNEHIFISECNIKIKEHVESETNTNHALEIDCTENDNTSDDDASDDTATNVEKCVSFSEIQQNPPPLSFDKENVHFEISGINLPIAGTVSSWNGKLGINVGRITELTLPCNAHNVTLEFSSVNATSTILVQEESQNYVQDFAVPNLRFIQHRTVSGSNVKSITIKPDVAGGFLLHKICYTCNDDDQKNTTDVSSDVTNNSSTRLSRLKSNPSFRFKPRVNSSEIFESSKTIPKNLFAKNKKFISNQKIKMTSINNFSTNKLTVVLPDEMHTIHVYFSKGSNGTIKMYDKPNHLIGTKFFNTSQNNIEQVELTVNQKLIQAIHISGDFKLIKICSITPDETQRVEENISLQEHQKESIVENWDTHFAEIFQPNHHYRIQVHTEVKRKKLDSNNWTAKQLTDVAYFKTENPPGAYDKTNVVETTNPPKNQNDPPATIEHYPTRGPLKNPDIYIKRTIPPQVASNEPLVPHYRSYDIGLETNIDYFEMMYKMASLDFEIKLYDNNDRIIVDQNGVPISLENHWFDNPELVQTREESQQQEVLNSGDCGIQVESSATTKSFNPHHKDMVLDPRTPYKAKLFAGPYLIYNFNFLTSKYCTFIHHIHSFIDSVWDYNTTQHGAIIQTILDAQEKSALTNILSSLNPTPIYNPQQNVSKEESLKFEQIAGIFKIDSSQYPERLEITQLSDEQEFYGLYLSSPEAIPQKRLSMKIKGNSFDKPIEETYSEIKIIDVKVDHSSPDWNNEYVDLLFQTKQLPQKIIIEHKKIIAPDDDFIEYHTLELDENVPAGRIIRIHSGTDPHVSSTSVDGIDRVYQNTNPNAWNFNPTGEEIRIKNERGEIIHTRTIVSKMWEEIEGFYTIWNYDQTKAFVFFYSENMDSFNLPSLNYRRLKMEFEFKRKTTDDEDVKMMRAGNDESEKTFVEFYLPNTIISSGIQSMSSSNQQSMSTG